MRLKNELYKEEQGNIINNIINILELDHERGITLYELDTNVDKQKKIMDLIPEIRKYFSNVNLKVKRQYLSIIKQVLKRNYNIYNVDLRITIDDNKRIRTTKYVFNKKEEKEEKEEK